MDKANSFIELKIKRAEWERTNKWRDTQTGKICAMSHLFVKMGLPVDRITEDYPYPVDGDTQRADSIATIAFLERVRGWLIYDKAKEQITLRNGKTKSYGERCWVYGLTKPASDIVKNNETASEEQMIEMFKDLGVELSFTD